MLDFSVLLEFAGQLVLTALVVEALTELVKANLPESLLARLNADAKRLIALIISALCFCVVPLQPFASVPANVAINVVAAVVASRGSNGVHDFLKLLRQAVESRQ